MGQPAQIIPASGFLSQVRAAAGTRRRLAIDWIKFSAVEEHYSEHRQTTNDIPRTVLPTLMTEADAVEDPAVSAETLVRRLCSSSPSQLKKKSQTSDSDEVRSGSAGRV